MIRLKNVMREIGNKENDLNKLQQLKHDLINTFDNMENIEVVFTFIQFDNYDFPLLVSNEVSEKIDSDIKVVFKVKDLHKVYGNFAIDSEFYTKFLDYLKTINLEHKNEYLTFKVKKEAITHYLNYHLNNLSTQE